MVAHGPDMLQLYDAAAVARTHQDPHPRSIDIRKSQIRSPTAPRLSRSIAHGDGEEPGGDRSRRERVVDLARLLLDLLALALVLPALLLSLRLRRVLLLWLLKTLGLKKF